MKSLLFIVALASVSLTILAKSAHPIRLASDDTTVTPDFGFGGDGDGYDDDGVDCDDDDLMVAVLG